MKHIRIFESFVSPEDFDAEVDKAIQMGDPVASVKHVRSLGIPKTLDGMQRRYHSLNKFATYMESFNLTPEQQDELRRMVDPEGYDKIGVTKASSLRDMRSEILDRFAAGEISKEEALDSL